ncbi:UDP-N-acetylglucosamine1-carboxyvinyltransferase [Desulfofarcimen acetoxidans DSM 771]|uniref:UDP-N-acetylglucosamine 1-carboxyvinyltransferase n=1 Tax=Desulfofarcimen acetoxidans (strain ATCC 49208 / DSM 771 / KCTC 5769 / VKM B-1644 / 5575) TaxID=485916 RepID=C8VZ86_DESAS|nr:UDP-N-acetylglucosamine 1-carboxyvinyltransferase [Desulfofarcimen acetoxidans]ACV64831.1 UDP-N-acetylglucosamine1-carboxyvinyltransferase [Desulfofarcimen acetoxidans DSM 771]
MPKLIVQGGRRLSGTVKISGAKNAVLPIIAAALLTGETSVLHEVPDLSDVYTICSVIESLGAKAVRKDKTLQIQVSNIASNEAPYDFVRRMRASFLIIGPLLARTGEARIPLPGGCAIGARPIDLHLKGLKALGAKITSEHGYIRATAAELHGAQIYLDFPSVGATENIMMAATLAKGRTVLENCAEEPEIVDLANFLNGMGAKIKGAGTKVIRIEGVNKLSGTTHVIIPDRIEAGTFLAAAAVTGSEITVENIIFDHLKPVIAKLLEAGVKLTENEGSIKVTCPCSLRAVDIKTMPYPGFPTDMQAQIMALMTVAKGTSILTETVFENRFMHVAELKRMGARIKTGGRTAVVQGVRELAGAQVKATDLRAGAALVIAGLAARGETEIDNIYHIERGYDRLIQKLLDLGAAIKRVDE